jgi:hypothetical protein
VIWYYLQIKEEIVLFNMISETDIWNPGYIYVNWTAIFEAEWI